MELYRPKKVLQKHKLDMPRCPVCFKDLSPSDLDLFWVGVNHDQAISQSQKRTLTPEIESKLKKVLPFAETCILCNKSKFTDKIEHNELGPIHSKCLKLRKTALPVFPSNELKVCKTGHLFPTKILYHYYGTKFWDLGQGGLNRFLRIQPVNKVVYPRCIECDQIVTSELLRSLFCPTLSQQELMKSEDLRMKALGSDTKCEICKSDTTSGTLYFFDYKAMHYQCYRRNQEQKCKCVKDHKYLLQKKIKFEFQYKDKNWLFEVSPTYRLMRPRCFCDHQISQNNLDLIFDLKKKSAQSMQRALISIKNCAKCSEQLVNHDESLVRNNGLYVHSICLDNELEFEESKDVITYCKLCHKSIFSHQSYTWLNHCGHQFHIPCLYNYVDHQTESKFLLTLSQIKQNSLHSCPKNCDYALTDQDIRKLMSNSEYLQKQEWRTMRRLKENEDGQSVFNSCAKCTDLQTTRNHFQKCGLFEYEGEEYMISRCEHGRRFTREDLEQMFSQSRIKEEEENCKL